MVPQILTAIYRTERARVIAGLCRLTRDIDAAEDALQEAMLKASATWQKDGLPDNPGAWLTTVAKRCAIDRMRKQQSESPWDGHQPAALQAPMALSDPNHEDRMDHSLALLCACCHSAIPERAQSALALHTVLGLSVREIARMFLEDERSTAQRLVRAKRTLKQLGDAFETPSASVLPEVSERIGQMVYLLFTEGHSATQGRHITRHDLVDEAIRLGRVLAKALDTQPVKSLLALMLLHAARLPARSDAQGQLVLLSAQDRKLFDRDRAAEGTRLLDQALRATPQMAGPKQVPHRYTVEAAIAALHTNAATYEATDWPQIAGLYGVLLQVHRTPVVELNAAIALGRAGKPKEALTWLNRLAESDALANSVPLCLAQADLLQRKGSMAHAKRQLARAKKLAVNEAERQHIEGLLQGLH